MKVEQLRGGVSFDVVASLLTLNPPSESVSSVQIVSKKSKLKAQGKKRSLRP